MAGTPPDLRACFERAYAHLENEAEEASPGGTPSGTPGSNQVDPEDVLRRARAQAEYIRRLREVQDKNADIMARLNARDALIGHTGPSSTMHAFDQNLTAMQQEKKTKLLDTISAIIRRNPGLALELQPLGHAFGAPARDEIDLIRQEIRDCARENAELTSINNDLSQYQGHLPVIQDRLTESERVSSTLRDKLNLAEKLLEEAELVKTQNRQLEQQFRSKEMESQEARAAYAHLEQKFLSLQEQANSSESKCRTLFASQKREEVELSVARSHLEAEKNTTATLRECFENQQSEAVILRTQVHNMTLELDTVRESLLDTEGTSALLSVEKRTCEEELQGSRASLQEATMANEELVQRFAEQATRLVHVEQELEAARTSHSELVTMMLPPGTEKDDLAQRFAERSIRLVHAEQELEAARVSQSELVTTTLNLEDEKRALQATVHQNTHQSLLDRRQIESLKRDNNRLSDMIPSTHALEDLLCNIIMGPGSLDLDTQSLLQMYHACYASDGFVEADSCSVPLATMSTLSGLTLELPGRGSPFKGSLVILVHSNVTPPRVRLGDVHRVAAAMVTCNLNVRQFVVKALIFSAEALNRRLPAATQPAQLRLIILRCIEAVSIWTSEQEAAASGAVELLSQLAWDEDLVNRALCTLLQRRFAGDAHQELGLIVRELTVAGQDRISHAGVDFVRNGDAILILGQDGALTSVPTSRIRLELPLTFRADGSTAPSIIRIIFLDIPDLDVRLPAETAEDFATSGKVFGAITVARGTNGRGAS